ncbi:hypothetical protein LPJ53_000213 [Coemansia erecta]|uniref:Uncharacterized protein n=1 Tax=Coemansia erecta TaxID=147472 RepID=A0A9W7Y7V4_9FUNG|nr:hypothetical protein LPJ53_000213 [Coemansia erecta]
MDPAPDASASAATPTKQGPRGLHQLDSSLRTPARSVLQRVSELTPQQKTPSFLAPFASPALRRLGEDALRDRLREAYQMLKEKERNLFLAATVGQELVDANQQLQDGYDRVHRELAEAQSRMRDPDGHEDRPFSTLHGRRKSMLMQQPEKNTASAGTGVDAAAAAAEDDSERQWIKVHLQPLKAQLQLAQERTDELLAEREDLATEIYTLRQEHAAALRRASEAMNVSDDAQRRIERLEEDKLQLQQELDSQRAFWAKRWADLQDERRAGAEAENSIQQAAQRQAEDAAARLRAEKRADDLQLCANATQAELELLRTQVQRMEEERVGEWEPMRERWLGCEEALQELQETHQSTCEALAQAEVRLAELDRSNELSDPVKLKNERTSTSLLGELDYQRHMAVSEQRTLARDHTVLKRAYTRSLNTQSRMKQQVSRLTQLAATGANEARMRRLEAALGEAECQQQALLWASMEHRRPAEIELATLTVGGSDTDGTALVTALRARVKQTAAERDQLQRELRTAHLLRANEIQRTRDLERDAADTESRLHRVLGELSAVKMEYESLKRNVKTESKLSRTHVDAETSPSALRQGDARGGKQQPERKRTAVAGDDKRKDVLTADGRRDDPMSLDFVINAGAGRVQSPSPTTPSKRRRVHGNDDSAGSTPRRSTKSKAKQQQQQQQQKQKSTQNGKGSSADPESAILSPKGVKQLPEIYEAADRGLKSWLGKLGAAHASATIAEATLENASSALNLTGTSSASGGIGGNDAHALAAAETSLSHVSAENDGENNSDAVPVNEIHISSRMSQKPMECNNQ